RRWAARMAADQRLEHNPNLGGEYSGWTAMGENVGTGGDVDSIHRAFVNDPEHYANMARASFNRLGVGVVRDDAGRLWVVEDFAAASGGTTSPPPPPPPPPTPPPPPPPSQPKPVV